MLGNIHLINRAPVFLLCQPGVPCWAGGSVSEASSSSASTTATSPRYASIYHVGMGFNASWIWKSSSACTTEHFYPYFNTKKTP